MRPWEHLAPSATGTKPAGSKRAQARFESSLLFRLLKKATYRGAVLSQYRAVGLGLPYCPGGKSLLTKDLIDLGVIHRQLTQRNTRFE